MVVSVEHVAIGDNITGATAGSVLFAGVSGNLAQNNANFFWDMCLTICTVGNDLYAGNDSMRVTTAGIQWWMYYCQ